MRMKNFFSASKKGAIEVQFNWMFVIIVGSLIILFFFSVVKTTGKASNEGIYIELKQHLDSILSQSQVDVGKTRTISLPRISLDIGCTTLDIEKASSAPKQIVYRTIFSPDKIGDGADMITYSQYWDMPYPVDYFLYITSRQIRYNIINTISGCDNKDSCKSLMEMIKKAFPANTTLETKRSASDVAFNNYDKERFIFISKNASDTDVFLTKGIEGMRDQDVTAINIIRPDANYGKVMFYKKKGDVFKEDKKSPYLGFQMLLGAIMSESTLYECNVNKTMLKFRIMSRIYYNRTAQFLSTHHTNSLCNLIYENAYSKFSSIMKALNTGMSLEAFETIAEKANEIRIQNENALMESCPLIY